MIAELPTATAAHRLCGLASMEPRSRDRGIGPGYVDSLWVVLLQWSRDHMIAEFGAIAPRTPSGYALQWSRDHVIAELLDRFVLRAISLPASMEPRSRDRGITLAYRPLTTCNSALQWSRDHVIDGSSKSSAARTTCAPMRYYSLVPRESASENASISLPTACDRWGRANGDCTFPLGKLNTERLVPVDDTSARLSLAF